MRINVHAGHNPDGMTGCGAIGIIKESTEARAIKDEVIRQLQLLGHTVYDCTVDNGSNASDVLKKIVAKCNAHEVDLDISIHLNAGRNDYAGDGATGGTEVFVYSTTSNAAPYAAGVADAIADLGYRNRGVKVSTGLYVLKNTKSPAMLIECCFVDDKDDVERYNYKTMASAIVYGLTGARTTEAAETPVEDLTEAEGAVSGDARKLYRVQVGAYSIKDNAAVMAETLKAAGFDAMIVSA